MIYTKEEKIQIIENICDNGGQNSEMIAEDHEDKGNEYDEEKADYLLNKIKKVLLNNIDQI